MRMTSRLGPFTALALLTLVAPLGAHAQEDEMGLRSRIEQELFTFGTCGEPLCLDLTNVHGNHFIPALSTGNDIVISFISDAIGNATLSVPLSATSSGATFSFEGGLPVRTSTSAGPVFGERTQTLGRNQLFLGVSVTGVEFTSLNGVPLDGMQLAFQHEDGDPADTLGVPFFENDVMTLQLGMDVNVLVGTAALTYGLTDFIDVGVAVPFVRTEVSGRSDAQIIPFGSTAIHRFGGDGTDPVLQASTSMEGSASGIGDVAARVKVNLGQGTRMGAAVLAEMRFATGDEENLLGTGSNQIRVMGLYSAQLGTFSPHLNVGYAARSGDTQRDGVIVQGAIDNLLTEWATLAAGLEGEFLLGNNPFILPSNIEIQSPFVRQFQATNIPNRDGDLLRASLGAKFTVRGGTVLVVNGIFPLRGVGLQPDFIWTVGLDFPFGG
jgi:hypothetical protein